MVKAVISARIRTAHTMVVLGCAIDSYMHNIVSMHARRSNQLIFLISQFIVCHRIEPCVTFAFQYMSASAAMCMELLYFCESSDVGPLDWLHTIQLVKCLRAANISFRGCVDALVGYPLMRPRNVELKDGTAVSLVRRLCRQRGAHVQLIPGNYSFYPGMEASLADGVHLHGCARAILWNEMNSYRGPDFGVLSVSGEKKVMLRSLKISKGVSPCAGPFGRSLTVTSGATLVATGCIFHASVLVVGNGLLDKQTTARFLRCTFSDGICSAVIVNKRARVSFEECNFECSERQPGIRIQGGNVQIINCTIASGNPCGLYVGRNGVVAIRGGSVSSIGLGHHDGSLTLCNTMSLTSNVTIAGGRITDNTLGGS